MKIFNIPPGSLSKCTELVLETPHCAKEWQHSKPLDTPAPKFGKIRKQKLRQGKKWTCQWQELSNISVKLVMVRKKL